jgi:uncharacterized protein YndB with AHSA1/START domain
MRWKVDWEAEVRAELAAAPDQVWEVLADVTRVGEWSHECHTARWLPGPQVAEVGARFTGSNRNGAMRWTRTCTITEVVPERRLVYRTGGGLPPDSTEWRFELDPTTRGGTVVTQSFRILKLPRTTELAIVLFMPPHRDRRLALVDDLVRLGEVAAGRVPTP